MRILMFLIVLTLSQPAFANEIDFIEKYGERIEFDVIRKGSKVGEHITTFEEKEGQLHVYSRMNIDIKALFIPVYSFLYKTQEVWQNGEIQEIKGEVLDGSDKLYFKAVRTEKGLEVTEGENKQTIEGTVIATNHWNPEVLNGKRVFNTLTANMNDVTITDKGIETLEVENGTVEATRYDYTGELTDTSVWYDEKGRWIKLEFLARDGSTISYRCRTCIEVSENLS